METKQTVTLDDLSTIKEAYNKAVEADQDQFTITLHDAKKADFYTPYAKYLIQYLENEIKSSKNRRKT